MCVFARLCVCVCVWGGGVVCVCVCVCVHGCARVCLVRFEVVWHGAHAFMFVHACAFVRMHKHTMQHTSGLLKKLCARMSAHV